MKFVLAIVKDFFLLIIAASFEGFVDKKRADAKVP